MADSNEYRKHRAHFLDHDKPDFDMTGRLAQEGTPIPERVCIRCTNYLREGWCEARRRDVGPLWEACRKYKEL